MKLKLPLAVLILLLIPLTVFAQATFRKDLKDKLAFEMDPGAKISHNIFVINVEDKPIDIELYATDGIITQSGSFSTLPRSSKQEGVGQWVQFKGNKVHLEGKQEKEVQFEIIIPAGATPGQYAGGLSLEPALSAVKLKATGATISTRIVMPLFIKIKGERVSAYEWTDFSHSFDQAHNFKLSFSNKGNTIIKIQGDILLKDITGEAVIIPIGDITLLQKETSVISVPWTEKPFFGQYTATASLKFLEFDMQAKKYNELGKQSRDLTFTVMPWGTIVLLISLIILLIALMVVKKIVHKSFVKRCVPYTVIAGDTITGIGNKIKVDWRKLAKINRLKPPFDLSPGQKILLPPTPKK